MFALRYAIGTTLIGIAFYRSRAFYGASPFYRDSGLHLIGAKKRKADLTFCVVCTYSTVRGDSISIERQTARRISPTSHLPLWGDPASRSLPFLMHPSRVLRTTAVACSRSTGTTGPDRTLRVVRPCSSQCESASPTRALGRRMS